MDRKRKVSRKSSSTPTNDNLKQACLPFKVLSEKNPMPTSCERKRKLSTSSIEVVDLTLDNHVKNIEVKHLTPCKSEVDNASRKKSVKNDEKLQEDLESSKEDLITPEDEVDVSQNDVSSASTSDTSVLASPAAKTTVVDTSSISVVGSSSTTSSPVLKKKKISLTPTERKILNEERENRRIEKEKIKKEHQEKKQAEAKAREEEKRKREEQKKKKDEEKEEEKRKREEEKRKREEEKRKKDEEKRKKDEEKLKKEEEKEAKRKEKEEEKKFKEEEKKKKEEEKKKKENEKKQKEEEEERRKEKAKAAFSSFFVPKKEKKEEVTVESPVYRRFEPFQVKSNMCLSPLHRCTLSPEQMCVLEEQLSYNNTSNRLYLEELKDGSHKPESCSETCLPEEPDLEIIEDDGICSTVVLSTEKHKHIKMKLLFFCENRRPPYWGTCIKKSESIRPRKPFAYDKSLDYEVDSDDEWEEEEPGESLEGPDEEDEPEDDYEVDEFLVPHGYLSDEEENKDEDSEDTPKISAEEQREILKIKEAEWAAERTVKTKPLQPRMLGCIWMGSNGFAEAPSLLAKYVMSLCIDTLEVPTELSEITSDDEDVPVRGSPTSPENPEKRETNKAQFPEEGLPHLVTLVHESPLNRGFLGREFLAFWNKQQSRSSSPRTLPLIRITEKIKEIAQYESKNKRWEVLPSVLSVCSPREQWVFITKRTTSAETSPVIQQEQSMKPGALITHFMKVGKGSPPSLKNHVSKCDNSDVQTPPHKEKNSISSNIPIIEID